MSLELMTTRRSYNCLGYLAGAAPLEICALALRKLLDFLLRHRLQARQKGFHLPLRHVIGEDELLRLRPDDVGHPVIQARRAPPLNGEPAGLHTTAPFDFCQWLPTRFHRAPLYESASIAEFSLGAVPSGMLMLRSPASNAYARPSRRAATRTNGGILTSMLAQ